MLQRLALVSILLIACGDDDGVVDPDASTDSGTDVGVDAEVDAGGDTMGLAANGESCTTPSECASGFCVDAVCCASACDGMCERCDESGDGTCAPIAADADPDAECGAVSCETHYVATADVCSYREDVTDSACDGAGACQDANALCPDQPAGAEQINCATCASLATDTCVDDTPGECTLATPFVDDFDGPDLDAGWTVDYLGGAPTFTVGGTLQITDSPPADTPSSSCTWIYDLGTDKGNQIGRAVAIGTGDFVLEVDYSASSTLGQLTLGGVALTNADDGLEIFAGFWDGGEDALGHAQGGVAPDALTTGWFEDNAEDVTLSVRIERVGGTVTTEVDGVLVDTATNAADIASLVIFHTSHECGPLFEYGTFEVDRISLCF